MHWTSEPLHSRNDPRRREHPEHEDRPFRLRQRCSGVSQLQMPPFQHFQPSLDLSESPWKSMNVAFTLEAASSLGAGLGASCAKAFGPLAENADSCPPL